MIPIDGAQHTLPIDFELPVKLSGLATFRAFDYNMNNNLKIFTRGGYTIDYAMLSSELDNGKLRRSFYCNLYYRTTVEATLVYEATYYDGMVRPIDILIEPDLITTIHNGETVLTRRSVGAVYKALAYNSGTSAYYENLKLTKL